jgi:hypothetical protein
MRFGEILRKMADAMDAQEGGQTSTEVTNRPAVVDVEVDAPTDTHDMEDRAQINTKTMVPPLQQKIDLMKKLAGIEGPCTSCGCDPCGCSDQDTQDDACGCDEPQDELAIMKQNAGITPFVVAVADEDEPFEG